MEGDIIGEGEGDCANISRGHANERVSKHDEWNYAQTSRATTPSNRRLSVRGERVNALAKVSICIRARCCLDSPRVDRRNES